MPVSRQLLDRLIKEAIVDETLALDFKSTPYTPQSRFDLLKDVMALANAADAATRLIIVGVKAPVDAPRTFHPIDPSTFEDDANLQQIVHEYIEPVVPFSWTRHLIEEGPCAGLYGVLEVEGDLDPPYIVRKQFSGPGRLALREGECWVRRGSSQHLISRRELDHMYAARNPFRDKIRVGFTRSLQKRLSVRAEPSRPYPSQERRRELVDALSSLGNTTPPTDWVAELKEIDGGRGFWRAVDAHHYFMERAVPLEVFILNEADRYLVDARVSLNFGIVSGLNIMQKAVAHPGAPDTTHAEGYPRVRYFSDEGLAVADVVGLKVEHHFLTPAFGSPIRVGFGREMIDRVYPIYYRIGASNLPTPITGELEIEVHP
jgi:hypothetical protein